MGSALRDREYPGAGGHVGLLSQRRGGLCLDRQALGNVAGQDRVADADANERLAMAYGVDHLGIVA